MSLIHGEGFQVTVVRSSRRRTVVLQIRDGQAVIRMPAHMPLAQAEQFVQQKKTWIKHHLAASPPPVSQQFRSGETLLFHGRPVTLTIHSAQSRNAVSLQADQLQLLCRDAAPQSAQLKQQLSRWLRQQAQAYLSERTQQLVSHTGLQPTQLTIRSYTARWGSCKTNGSIQLNWKLIMAPPSVSDYVIIHELCHLRHHNHSPAFWQLVAQFDPNFKQHRDWLKRHGQQLNI